MASIGLCPSAFRRVNQSSCTSNSSSSFSIRNILNLPESENPKQCAQTLDDISASCPDLPYPPLVPRVVWPSVDCYNGYSLYGGLINQQTFLCAPQHSFWSSLADKTDKEIPFKGQQPKQQANASREAGVNVFPKKRRRPMRKKKKRPLFSPHQIQTMEKEFAKQRYVTEEKRAQLASEVNLTETQVKTWFQNRRTKWKKEKRDEQIATTRRPSQEDIKDATEKYGRSFTLTMGGNNFCQNNCATFGFV